MKRGMPEQLRQLMEKYNALGRLLPAEADMDMVVKDPRALAEATLVLKEMSRVKAAIDAFLLRHGRRAREMETP
jgi:hypothetical protein